MDFLDGWVRASASKDLDYTPEGSPVVTVVCSGRDASALLPDDEAKCAKGANWKGESVMGRKKKAKAERKKRKLLRFLVIGGGTAAVIFALKQRTAGTGSPPCSPEERLMVKDEEHLSGLGAIMKSLIGEFLKEPAKVKILDTMNLVLAIEPTDQPETAITFTFSNGYVIIEPGVVPNPDIKIMCTLEVLLQVSQMPAGPAALKYMQTPEGKELAGKFRTGELKIQGLATHPMGMMKFSKFLAPKVD